MILYIETANFTYYWKKMFWKHAANLQETHPCRNVISITLLCNFIEVTLQHWCSLVNLLHIFRTSFHKNNYGGLLPYMFQWLPIPHNSQCRPERSWRWRHDVHQAKNTLLSFCKFFDQDYRTIIKHINTRWITLEFGPIWKLKVLFPVRKLCTW